MQRENKDRHPISYKNAEEMDKPLSELMEELRIDLSKIRGKLFDIKKSYGWEDRIEHIKGGLTCMLVAMSCTMEEWKKFEDKHGQNNALLNTIPETNKQVHSKNIPIAEMQKFENCFRSFIRTNHLSGLFDKHCEEWEKNIEKLPKSAFDR